MTPTNEQEWEKEFHKGLRFHLETYFAAGNGISEEDALRLATDTITFQVSELLSTQLEAAEKRIQEVRETPMGVSEWMNHGKKYNYDKYFKIVWPKE